MDNKVPQQINDIVGDNVKKLAQLFPYLGRKKECEKDCSGRCYWKNTKIHSRG